VGRNCEGVEIDFGGSCWRINTARQRFALRRDQRYLNWFPDHLDASGIGVEQFACDFHIYPFARAAPKLQFPRVGVPTFVLGKVTRQKPALATAWATRRNDDHVVPDGFSKCSEIPDHDK